ncbi:hypothetical protein J2T15_004449 [Paenibacillus harenae]|uniref:Uncharacterized protein n=1 Tax=Paenibacillus harenae TaxID=306543 RepID=A0ABT9U5S1_PAEHA|nr:hypothetical protein [Paenibacillus harenae]MDQ0114992.1 hypothetical protein [Paenibacillus harenae]
MELIIAMFLEGTSIEVPFNFYHEFNKCQIYVNIYVINKIC